MSDGTDTELFGKLGQGGQARQQAIGQITRGAVTSEAAPAFKELAASMAEEGRLAQEATAIRSKPVPVKRIGPARSR